MRAVAAARVQARLKEHPHTQLQREVQAICEVLDDPFDAPVPADSPYAILDRETIDMMASSGLVEFGAHTHSHAILGLLSIQQQKSEILRSVEGVRRLPGQTGELFAYPNGRPQDYTPASIEILRSVGVRAAVTAVHRVNDADAAPMELSRFSIGADVSDAEFEEILDSVHA
jgi:peptidoglycan/xylan/chitin deacetylase (PgdA/CDA1 family)